MIGGTASASPGTQHEEEYENIRIPPGKAGDLALDLDATFLLASGAVHNQFAVAVSYYDPSEFHKHLGANVPWSSIHRQLKAMRDLTNDWNGYGAIAPNTTAIKNTEDILEILHDMFFVPISLDPSAVNGVGISFVKEERRAIIECDNEGYIVAATYKNDGDPNVWVVANHRSGIKDSLRRLEVFINGSSTT